MYHAHIRIITSGMVAQQQQHAERGTVEVGGFLQVNHHRIGPAGLTLVGVTKFLVLAEIEASLDLDGQFFPSCEKSVSTAMLAIPSMMADAAP